MNKNKQVKKTKKHLQKKQKIKEVVKVIEKAAPSESIGQTIGKWVGGGVQNLISKITGLGDYTVSGARAVDIDCGPPQFSPGRNVRVAHREYLGDITCAAPGDFKTDTYTLNPGNVDTFPWLSNIAKNFEEYRFHGLVFEFKSTSANALNSTNTALGTVIMATQYDSVEETFSNKRDMENHEFASSTKPSQSVLHGVETKPKYTSISTNLYVLSGAQPADTDKRLYDLGKFTIATTGMQAQCVIGELWVTYDIEFYKPQLLAAIPNTTAYAHYYNATLAGTLHDPFTGIDGGTITGMTPVTGSSTTLVTFGINRAMSFNVAGNYLCAAIAATNSGTIPTQSTSWVAVGATQIGEINNDPGFPYNSFVHQTNGSFSFYNSLAAFHADVGATVNLTFADSATTSLVYCDVLVVPLPDVFTLPLTKEQQLTQKLESLLYEKLCSRLGKYDSLNSTPNEFVEVKTNLTESTLLARALTQLAKIN